MSYPTGFPFRSVLILGLLAMGCHGVGKAPRSFDASAVTTDTQQSQRGDGFVLTWPDVPPNLDTYVYVPNRPVEGAPAEAGVPGADGQVRDTRPVDAAATDAPQISLGDGGSSTADTDPSMPDPTCLPSGAPCSAGSDCCTGACDPASHTCMSSISQCVGAGYACTTATDCCNLSCTNGRCAEAAACVPDNQACTSPSACCSGSCSEGTCKPLNTACKTAGNPCGGNSECCSGGCSGGKCSLAVSYCIQTGDICFRSTDCCSGSCQIAAGRSAGVCAELVTSGAGSCAKDGTVCQDCTNCCSALCAPYARSGISICQPASGCRVTNNLCTKDSDCCGGDSTSGLPGAGNVTCTIAEGSNPPLGVCRNPQGCNPQGGVCGLKSGVTVACTNAREDCCDCLPPKAQCCKPDSIGVPRCYGGSTQDCPTGYTGKEPCCIHGGERCTFSAECCGGVPCVPGSDGILRCMFAPDGGGPICVPSGGACTTTGDCCAGMTCNIAPGSPSGICGAPPKAPPPPDSGVKPLPDSGTTLPDPNQPDPNLPDPNQPDPNLPDPNQPDPNQPDPNQPDPNQPLSTPDAAVSPPDAPLPECALYGQLCSTSVPCCDAVTCAGPGFVNRSCQPGELGCTCRRLIF